MDQLVVRDMDMDRFVRAMVGSKAMVGSFLTLEIEARRSLRTTISHVLYAYTHTK